MALPLSPPVLPQLARPAKTLPTGAGWVYEPKWDGFRMLAFVDGGKVYLQSRSGKPMTRYFPERAFPEGRYVLDGEIVLFDEQGRQDFDALGQRIHTSGLSAKRKRELIDELKPYETGQRGMGDPSRWANDRDLEWVELRPELVVEVMFDHTSNDRIRHGAKIARWRDDKPPAECGMDQLLN